jgi:hypothetical protein
MAIGVCSAIQHIYDSFEESCDHRNIAKAICTIVIPTIIKSSSCYTNQFNTSLILTKLPRADTHVYYKDSMQLPSIACGFVYTNYILHISVKTLL